MSARLRLTVVGLVAALGVVGCGIPTGDMVVFTADSPELAHASVSEAGVWESVPWSSPDAPWLSYPGRVTVQLEHTLGRTPSIVLVYLAFDAAATTTALAAGDLAEVLEVTDTTITIRNDTNGSYFFRVVAF